MIYRDFWSKKSVLTGFLYEKVISTCKIGYFKIFINCEKCKTGEFLECTRDDQCWKWTKEYFTFKPVHVTLVNGLEITKMKAQQKTLTDNYMCFQHVF